MNENVNQFLLTEGKIMSLETTCFRPRTTEFLYSACKPFTEHCKRIHQFKETGYSNCIYCIKLDKACFSHAAVCTYLRQSFEGPCL